MQRIFGLGRRRLGRTFSRACLAALVGACVAGVLLAAVPLRADLVAVVGEPRLRPAMAEWVEHRAAQGHRFVWLTDADAARLGELREATRPGERLALVLLGDGRSSGLPPQLTPSRVVARYGPETDIATDHPYAETAGADAIGRLPFNDQAALRGYLSRVLQREKTPTTWGDARLQVAAGVGGFSPFLDAAIEGAAASVVTRLAPTASELSLTRYSDAPPAAQPRPTSQTQRGGVWVWMGHGLRDRLPGIAGGQLGEVTGGADTAVLLACYTGDFVAAGECVAERMLAAPRGPLAVIAATRVSMPYGNARLGAELLDGWRNEPDAQVGALLQRARRDSLRDATTGTMGGLDRLATMLSDEASSLGDERQDHASLYQLLGDPLIAIDRTNPLELTIDETLGPDDELVIRGFAPTPGDMRVEVAKPTKGRSGRRGQRTTYAHRVEAGKAFAVRLPLDDQWRSGVRLVRVGVQGEAGLAIGASLVRRTTASAERVAALSDETSPR